MCGGRGAEVRQKWAIVPSICDSVTGCYLIPGSLYTWSLSQLTGDNDDYLYTPKKHQTVFLCMRYRFLTSGDNYCCTDIPATIFILSHTTRDKVSYTKSYISSGFPDHVLCQVHSPEGGWKGRYEIRVPKVKNGKIFHLCFEKQGLTRVL